MPAHPFIFWSWMGSLQVYLKLNEAFGRRTDNTYDTQSLDNRTYLFEQAFQNRGLGSVLIKKAVETAEVRKQSIYLARRMG